jgi:hypothetical protein
VWEEEPPKASARTLVWTAAALALVGVACAAAVHTGCFHPPPPVTRPDPGTARGEYCGVIVPSHPWWSLTIGPPVVALVGAMLSRRRLSIVVVVSGTLLLLLMTNAILANVLTSAQTV